MTKKSVVTPWEVKGNIDYSKIIREFGVSPLDKKLITRLEKLAGSSHHFLRRGVYFAHRDLKFALDQHDKKNLFLYTGCGPSGPIHLGHASVWLFTKWLQEKLGLDLWFQFTDDEKFLFKEKLTYEETQKWLHENMLDVIALGFDPKKTHFVIDTKHAHLLYPEAIKVAKRLTFSQVKSAFGLTASDNVGKIFYTSMQAVPAFLPSVLKKKKMACLIPHAIDQDPHFRLTRDILPKLGYFKPASIQGRFLPGLGGMEEGKSSSSEGSTIYLTDDAKTVAKKINKYAFSGGQDTIEKHRKLGGNPDIDVAFQWLVFFEEDDKMLASIAKAYKKGDLLSGELKKILIDKLNKFLAEHQKKRKTAAKKLKDFIYRG